MSTSDVNNRVELGSAVVEQRTNTPYQYNVWGEWQLRKKEFAAVRGAVKKPHNWGYELPATTDPAVIEALRAPVYAEPAADLVFERDNSANYVQSYVVYTCRAYGAEFALVVHPDAVIVRAEPIEILRVAYHISIEYRRNEAGVWVGKWRYTSRPDDYRKDLSDAARIEALRLFGSVLAAFLSVNADAFTIATRRALNEQKRDLERQIANAERQLADLKAQLYALESPVA